MSEHLPGKQSLKCSGMAQVRVRIGRTKATQALVHQPSAKPSTAKHITGRSRSKAKGHRVAALLGAISGAGRPSRSSKPGF